MATVLSPAKTRLQTMPNKFLPYGRQFIDEDDIAAVVEVLRSNMLTTGPKVAEFEQAVAYFVGSSEAVAVNSGTAALHAAMYALNIKPGDEVIVPPMTFAASANCIVYQGGTPVFADVDPNTLLIDPEQVEAKITARTKAIIAVDYAGQPCNYDALRSIANRHGLHLVADACHAIGAEYHNQRIGSLADLTVFSFHPVKHITTGEGGMVVTNNPKFAERLRTFRNHGITTDHRQRAQAGSFYYEMTELGYNYRLCDIQCALGISQLRKLPRFIARRQYLAACYDRALAECPFVTPLACQNNISHAYHLYVVRFDTQMLNQSHAEIFTGLRNQNIGVNVHYIPVHLHPFYRNTFGTQPGMCPVAEAAYEQIMTLPIFPQMTEQNIDDVVAAIQSLHA